MTGSPGSSANRTPSCRAGSPALAARLPFTQAASSEPSQVPEGDGGGPAVPRLEPPQVVLGQVEPLLLRGPTHGDLHVAVSHEGTVHGVVGRCSAGHLVPRRHVAGHTPDRVARIGGRVAAQEQRADDHPAHRRAVMHAAPRFLVSRSATREVGLAASRQNPSTGQDHPVSPEAGSSQRSGSSRRAGCPSVSARADRTSEAWISVPSPSDSGSGLDPSPSPSFGAAGGSEKSPPRGAASGDRICYKSLRR